MLAEVSALKTSRPAFAPLFTNQFGINHQNWVNKVSSKVLYCKLFFNLISTSFAQEFAYSEYHWLLYETMPTYKMTTA
jgi:hypothetical protein